ncbi:hypothetical protein D3C81_1808750 [compost metagenome]
MHGLDRNNGTRLIRQRHEQEACGEHQTGKSEQRQLLESVTVSAQGEEDRNLAQGRGQQRPAHDLIACIHGFQAECKERFVHSVANGQNENTAEKPQHFFF